MSLEFRADLMGKRAGVRGTHDPGATCSKGVEIQEIVAPAAASQSDKSIS